MLVQERILASIVHVTAVCVHNAPSVSGASVHARYLHLVAASCLGISRTGKYFWF